MWVEPQRRFTFTPSGLSLMTYVLAPSASNTARPIIHALPFEQSSATLRSPNERVAMLVR